MSPIESNFKLKVLGVCCCRADLVLLGKTMSMLRIRKFIIGSNAHDSFVALSNSAVYRSKKTKIGIQFVITLFRQQNHNWFESNTISKKATHSWSLSSAFHLCSRDEWRQCKTTIEWWMSHHFRFAFRPKRERNMKWNGRTKNGRKPEFGTQKRRFRTSLMRSLAPQFCYETRLHPNHSPLSPPAPPLQNSADSMDASCLERKQTVHPGTHCQSLLLILHQMQILEEMIARDEG